MTPPAPGQMPVQMPGGPSPGIPPPPPPGIQQPPGQKPSIFDDQVLELLKSDTSRSFRIDIETDSTTQPDENKEKELRTEFLTAFGGFLNSVGPVVMQAPQLTPMLAEMLKFAVRGYRAGRTLEEVIERTLDRFAAAAAEPKGPSPEEQKLEHERMKAEADAALQERKMQLEEQKAQVDAASKAEEMQLQLEMKRMELQLKQFELDMKRSEHEMRLAEMQMQWQLEKEKAALQREQMEFQASHERSMRGFEMAKFAMEAREEPEEAEEAGEQE